MEWFHCLVYNTLRLGSQPRWISLERCQGTTIKSQSVGTIDMDLDRGYLLLQQFYWVDLKPESLRNIFMDLEHYDIDVAQFYSVDLKSASVVTNLLDLERSRLLFERIHRMGDKFEPNGSLFSCVDVHYQQLPRVLVLDDIHRTMGTLLLGRLFYSLLNDLDLELHSRLLLFPPGLPRLFQLPPFTYCVVFGHRELVSGIPARSSQLCLWQGHQHQPSLPLVVGLDIPQLLCQHCK